MSEHRRLGSYIVCVSGDRMGGNDPDRSSRLPAALRHPCPLTHEPAVWDALTFPGRGGGRRRIVGRPHGHDQPVQGPAAALPAADADGTLPGLPSRTEPQLHPPQDAPQPRRPPSQPHDPARLRQSDDQPTEADAQQLHRKQPRLLSRGSTASSAHKHCGPSVGSRTGHFALAGPSLRRLHPSAYCQFPLWPGP